MWDDRISELLISATTLTRLGNPVALTVTPFHWKLVLLFPCWAELAVAVFVLVQGSDTQSRSAACSVAAPQAPFWYDPAQRSAWLVAEMLEPWPLIPHNLSDSPAGQFITGAEMNLLFGFSFSAPWKLGFMSQVCGPSLLAPFFLSKDEIFLLSLSFFILTDVRLYFCSSCPLLNIEHCLFLSIWVAQFCSLFAELDQLWSIAKANGCRNSHCVLLANSVVSL